MSGVAQQYMARALQLAVRGLYTTQPNPRVGCVLVKQGETVGEGWHRCAGEAHAEVHALQQAGARARGATAYVTLEPCCHTGRTPPCTEALIEARVARVVCAMLDPNPLMAGKGLQQLEQAGIAVESGVLQAQAEALNPGFVMRMRNNRPWVRCKLAMSLDGRTALANGESRWITGAPARADVQRLRAQSAAIMTGIGTVLSDDPSLTVRLEDWQPASEELPGDAPLSLSRQPLRVVLDTQLRMPDSARMLGLPGRTLICTASSDEARKAALMAQGAAMASFPAQGNKVDLAAVMRCLATEYAVNEVLLEAGAVLSGAMLEAGLIDELVIYLAPVLLGDSARGLFRVLAGLEDMQGRLRLEISEIRAVGGDWRITARPAPLSLQ